MCEEDPGLRQQAHEHLPQFQGGPRAQGAEGGSGGPVYLHDGELGQRNAWC